MKVELVKLSEISPDPANVRVHSERNIEAVVASFRAFGQQKPIVVDGRGIILAGNGQYEAAKRLGWESILIHRTDLAGASATAYAIADNRTGELAEWDERSLAETLKSLDIEGFDIESIGFTEYDLKLMMEDSLTDALEEQYGGGSAVTYSKTVLAPIYEPKGEKPEISELIDRTKADSLIADIEKSGLPSEIKSFLKAAAERHVVFNFRNIAEYYCHASSQLQNHMEQSGLIIIDFNKAIQHGFVHLTDQLGRIADMEMGLEGYEDDETAE